MPLPDHLSVVGVLHQPSSEGNRQDKIYLKFIWLKFSGFAFQNHELGFCDSLLVANVNALHLEAMDWVGPCMIWGLCIGNYVIYLAKPG